MRLPDITREHLHTEFRIAADRMAATPDLLGKLYFFSAMFGEANRVLNRQWDDELALMHLVISAAHGTIMGRLSQPSPVGESMSGIPDELPDALTKIAADLADLLREPEQDSESLLSILSRLAVVAYSTTGNGYYLYLKGAIEV
jgi:hypothetical protein